MLRKTKMRLGGLTKASFSDWPGRVAAVVFTQGCNFRCPFCHNPQLIPAAVDPASAVDPAGFFAFLEARRGKLDGVVVCGGEPTLQPDLPEFLRGLKALGFQVKLDTNGSKPAILRALLREELLDHVAMDVKAPFGKYPVLAGVASIEEAVCESLEVISRSGVEHEFRTTFVEGLLTEEDLAEIEAMIPVGSPHKRQLYRPPPGR